VTAVRRLVRAAAVLALAGLAVLAGPAPAQAHAYLARSAPADGAVLDRAPETLSLTFTERVELSSARVAVVDGDGRHWTVTALALRTRDGADAGTATAAGTESPVTLVAGLPTLPANTYHVSWRTLSSDDLHTTSGTLVFGVGRTVTAAGRAGPVGPAPRETVARALGLLGLAVLLGGAGLAAVHAGVARRDRSPGPSSRPDHPEIALRRRMLRVAGYGGVLALLATPLQLFIQLEAAGAGRAGLLLDQLTGGRWLLREVGTAALLAALWWLSRPRPVGAAPAVAVAVVGAVAASAGTALLGHPTDSPLRTTLVGAVHVLGAGGWAGGVLVAALALLPAARGAPDRAGQVRAVLHAFAVLAVTCLTGLVLTGLLLTGAQVATVDALLTSPYGLLLLAKLVAATAAGLLGLRTARRLRRRDDLPRRGLVTEAGLLAVALALAGSLAAAGPARGPGFPVAETAAAVPQVSGQAADLVDAVAVRPNRPGRNIVSITVSDTRRPAPAPVTGVSLLLTGPNGERALHPVTRTPDGWVVTVDDIRVAGDWRVAVTVLRDGLPPVTDSHPWVVPATDPVGAPVRVSAAPLRPVLDLLAVLGAVVAAAGALWAGRRWQLRRSAATMPSERIPRGGTPVEADVDGPAQAGAGAEPDRVGARGAGRRP
jgi:copper transport protein